MTGLGHAAKLDSGAMRTIAVVTMAFLPPTFISVSLSRCLLRGANLSQAVFSMSFFNYAPAQGTEAARWSVSEKFWIYWVLAVPLTCLTIAIWFWQQKLKNAKS